MTPHIFMVFLILIVEFDVKSCINALSLKDTVPPITVEDYRLKNYVFPINYNIELNLTTKFYKEKNFTGAVKIEIHLNAAEITDEIILNAKNLTITTVTLYQKTKDSDLLHQTEPLEYIPLLDRIKLKLGDQKLIKSNIYIIDIKYVGSFQDDMHGFYRSSYRNPSNQDEWLAITHLHAVNSREVFPCFDEPNFKATFNITIIHPPEYHALSNEVIRDRRPNVNGMAQTSFKTTPKMSTYLLAFVVSTFSSLPAIENNRVWSREGLSSQREYGVNLSPKIIAEMNKITKIPYSDSIAKLDQIAIPDLPVGAMENWGLITYRESNLLWNEESNTRSKQDTASTIAHELSHMWFGNLVTLDWWSSAWLNEGFARYFEYFLTHRLEHTWEIDDQFVIEKHQSVLIDDALLASHALTLEENEVLTPKQIINRFNSITYNKGASIIRMMRYFVGDDIFWDGIKNYFAKNNGKNTKPKDVWDAFDYNLTETLTLETIMNTWTVQAGFPVINVDILVDPNNTNSFILNQKRFHYHEVNKTPENSTSSENKSNGTKEEKPPTWYIPISFTTSNEKEFEETSPNFWLKPDDKDYKLENVTAFESNESSWIIFNIQSSAYIRVNYSQELWKAIEHALKEPEFDGIHVLNRAQIVDDAMNLARAGEIPYSTALDIIFYLGEETEYYPWYSALKAFEYIMFRFGYSSKVTKLLNIHIKNLMENLHQNVSTTRTNSNHIMVLKKVMTLEWLCHLDHEDCIKNAQELFTSFRENNRIIEPDLQKVVYCTAIRKSNNMADWEFLKNRLTKTQSLSEISAIISALGCTRDVGLLRTYLEYSINPTLGIRRQDAQSIFIAVINGNHVEGPPIAFNFLQENLKKIKQNYGGTGALATILIALSERLFDSTQVASFEEFIKKTDLGDASEAVNDALERCLENLEWVDRHSSELLKYLEVNVVPKPPSTTIKDTTTTELNIEQTTATPGVSTIKTTTEIVIATTTESNGRTTAVCATILILGINTFILTWKLYA